MIHYTVLPLETVMEGIEEMTATSVEMVVDGITMQVQPMNATQASIVRIISPNPQDYLNPSYAPGSVITLHPTVQV